MLSDDALEERLYGPRSVMARRELPDFEYLHAERKKPGVTLELLHLEYLEKHPEGCRYTAFCERYREWLRRRGLTDVLDRNVGVHAAGRRGRYDRS